MADTWPEPVERVAAFLRSAGAEARVEEFTEVTPTAADAARVVGCELPQIVKSLVFECDAGTVLVLVPGDRRADSRKVARAAGCRRVAVAGPERVREATGFVPGAVAPFALPGRTRVLADRGVLAYDVVWVGAGSERHLAAIAPAELLRLAEAEAVDVAGAAPSG
jgi:prolyl-tRNA editing enzyme YbaK/EbsC (Cys-tRNA(Pro) deacylase)